MLAVEEVKMWSNSGSTSKVEPIEPAEGSKWGDTKKGSKVFGLSNEEEGASIYWDWEDWL